VNNQKTQSIIDRVYADLIPQRSDLEYLLSLEDSEDVTTLFDSADRVRREFCSDEILLRGIVEFSSYCSKTCLYCGLNRFNNTLSRYRLDKDEILTTVEHIVSSGIKTVVLQAGQEDQLDVEWLKTVIEAIKKDFDIAITLSVGERNMRDYQLWADAGADRYLLKIETSNKELYESLHPDMSFENRVRCLEELKDIGYQVGSGNLVGLRGQAIRTLAEDILFFNKHDFDMLGIGLFIPHNKTQLQGEKAGGLDMVLKVLAVTRIVTRDTHLPATTAVGSIGDGNGRMAALQAGANVLMPNYTPLPYRKQYEIYPGKRCVDEKPGDCVNCMENMAASIGRSISYSRGDSLKKQTNKVA
jgi:biotin synthase